jgi:TrmH family RNA methyltransferase
VTTAALGARHPDVRRLRALLRDPAARRAESRIVLEGPRLVGDALRRGVLLEAVYVEDPRAPVLVQVHDAGAPVRVCAPGVLARASTTRTPQPVLAVAPAPAPTSVGDLRGAGPVLVAVGVAEPGNLGTLLRSAEAAGAAGVVCGGESVDVRNPKVVRASAGAVFGVPVVEAVDAVQVLDGLRAAGRGGWGATATDGTAYTSVDLAAPITIVVGNEARGLPEDVRAHLDGTLTVPMAGAAESLNVAVAGSVLLFEAARRRAERAGTVDG